MTNKLPWLLAALPLLGAIYSGCGAGTSTNGYTGGGGDGGNGASSGVSPGSSGAASSGATSSGGGSSYGDDGPTSND